MFEILAFLTLISALMVISAKNPVHSVLYLVLVFFNSTAILISWNMDFLAMTLLIVYVGAIAILFLFVVMMLNIKLVEIYENQMRYLPIGGLLALIFLVELYLVLEQDVLIPNEGLFSVVSANWEYSFERISPINGIGQILYTEYLSLFFIAGLILLISMIGAILLTELNKVEVKQQKLEDQIQRNMKEALIFKT